MASMNNKRAQLERRLDEIQKSNAKLSLENSVFQRYIDIKQTELGVTDHVKKGRKKNQSNAPQTLTNDQRYDVSNVVNEDITNEIDENKKEAEKMIDILRAMLEETEMKICEMKRDAYEFKRDVVVGAENSRTGAIAAEKVLKYFDDKARAVDASIEKLRLKNSTLKAQIHKVESQIAQKEEIGGDVLHFIDFHQLQIENKQHVMKIKERNEELMAVKLSAGKTLRVLNEHKLRLSEQMADTKALIEARADKKGQLQKIELENTVLSKDLLQERKQRNQLRQQVEESSDLPNIGDYIEQKRAMYAMESSLKNWRKKLEILEMAARQSHKIAAKAKLERTV